MTHHDVHFVSLQSKELLAAKIDEYIRERVTLADEVIVEFAKQKIKDGDVVLTYARSVAFQPGP